MQRHIPATDEDRSPVEKLNEPLTEGQTKETKPVTVIPWYFIGLGVLAVVAMVLFLISNRH